EENSGHGALNVSDKAEIREQARRPARDNVAVTYRPLASRPCTGCRTAAAEAAAAQASLSRRRSRHGRRTLSHSSRVPMMEIEMLKGIRKYRTRNTRSVA